MTSHNRASLRWTFFAACAASGAVAACNLDRVIEGTHTPETQLAAAIQPTSVTVPQGGTATASVAVTRLGGFQGDIALSVTDVPPNVDVTIGPAVATGTVSTSTVTVTVGAGVPAGSYAVTVRGTGGNNGAASASLTIQVTAVPAITLTLSDQTLTIIRGGGAPLGIAIARVNAPDPVTLSLIGPAGITAVISANPVSGSNASATISVAPSVAPGTYAVSLRGSSAGAPDRLAALTLVVPADSLQLLTSEAETAQASVVSRDILINRFGSGDALAFSAEGLPANVSASFQGGSGSEASATVTFAVGAAAPTGTFIVTLRGRSQRLGDAAVQLQLRILESRVAMTLSPPLVTVNPGSMATLALTLARTAFTGVVNIEASSSTSGVSISAAQSSLTGNSTVLTVAVDRSVAPGSYSATVRAIALPAGGAGTPALDPIAGTVTITVGPSSGASASVVLDWSACASPQWVAMQDGTGPWTPVVGTQGMYQFTVSTDRAGFAYSTPSEGLVVRYGTFSELSAAPIVLCTGAPPSTKSVRGSAQHAGPIEVFTWQMGGGSAVSTQAAPDFTITGVRDGTHDLIGTGTTQQGGYRYALTRDLNLLAGESVGLVSIVGPNSFAPAIASLGVGGLAGDSGVVTMSYLSGSACTPAELRKVGFGATAGNLATFIYGVPTVNQRADDYHLLEIASGGGAGHGARTASVSFHSLLPRSVALPAVVAPTVQPIAGPYKRLQAQLDATAVASAGSTVTLRYVGGTHTSTVTASVASLGSGALVLDMPDLSGVGGFPAAAAIASNASGTWSLALNGSNGQPLCSEGATRWSSTHRGTF